MAAGERASQVPDLNVKICDSGPCDLLKTAKRREIAATLDMQLDFPMPKGRLGPSNSTMCPRSAP